LKETLKGTKEGAVVDEPDSLWISPVVLCFLLGDRNLNLVTMDCVPPPRIDDVVVMLTQAMRFRLWACGAATGVPRRVRRQGSPTVTVCDISPLCLSVTPSLRQRSNGLIESEQLYLTQRAWCTWVILPLSAERSGNRLTTGVRRCRSSEGPVSNLSRNSANYSIRRCGSWVT
jgi:hypothetical protein